MIGSFKCSRNSLVVLNIFYIVVGIFLIGLATHWRTSSKISSLPIIGGVVACGVFLLLVSILGVYATIKHHQVSLFFYMVILFILFLIQFSIACACLAVSETTQERLAGQGWQTVSNSVKQDAQTTFQCCGFKDLSLNETEPLGHPSCTVIDECVKPCTDTKNCCIGDETPCGCGNCSDKIHQIIAQAFQVTGAVSLFFSFTEIIGAVVAYRYRNIYNPSAVNNILS